MVIDTVNDVVIGDVGDEIVNTGGVAVRPFWWSTECLQALGYASGETGGDTTAGPATSTDTPVTTGGGGGTGGQTGTTGAGTGSTAGGQGSGESGGDSESRASEEGGLAGWVIALIAVLAVIAVAALAALAYLLGKAKGGPGGRGLTTGSAGGGVAAGSAPVLSHDATGTGAATTPASCSHCGNPLSAGAQFCGSCGKPVQSPQS